ncbi:MAG: ATP-dependent Clp protease adaptor ClpS [Spirochaetales bacterium]
MAGKEDLSIRDDAYTQELLKDKLKEPDMYRVVLYNDHYTTQEFVVSVIMAVFHKSAAEATKIMLDVHRRGKGTIGVYPYDIAATKANQVRQLAKAQQFPLKCTVEKA